MVTFYGCKKYDPEDENVINRLAIKVDELQTKFGDRGCLCHPEYKWQVAVDISGDDIYKVHTGNDGLKMPCDLVKKLISREIIPFLSNP